MHVSDISIHEYLHVALRIVQDGGSVLIPVIGGSMTPTLRDGRDKVLLQRKPQYQRGDIILFAQNHNRYVLHRIVRIDHDSMLSCGDGNMLTDGWMPTASILCAAVKFERSGSLHSLEAFPWRQFGRIWMALYPVRPFLLRAYRFACKVRRKLLSLFSHQKKTC